MKVKRHQRLVLVDALSRHISARKIRRYIILRLQKFVNDFSLTFLSCENTAVYFPVF